MDGMVVICHRPSKSTFSAIKENGKCGIEMDKGICLFVFVCLFYRWRCCFYTLLNVYSAGVIRHYGHLCCQQKSRRAETRNQKMRGWGVHGVHFCCHFRPFAEEFFLDQIILLQKGGHTKSALAES